MEALVAVGVTVAMLVAVWRSATGRQIKVRLAPYLPWTDGTGRAWRGWVRPPIAAPFMVSYLIVMWALFVPLAHHGVGKYELDQTAIGPYVYRIPDLRDDPLAVLRSLVTAPFLNHDSIQLVYISILVLLFGIAVEVREGTRTTVLIFVVGLLTGALGAGVLLHLVYPEITTAPVYAYAWERTWSGGSAGCFALMGVFAASARRPVPLLVLFVLWDLHWPLLRYAVTGKGGVGFDLVWWHPLHSYTSAFHLIALPVGFLAARYLLAPVVREGGLMRSALPWRQPRPADPEQAMVGQGDA